MSRLTLNNNASDPSAPAAGKLLLFSKTDRLLYIEDDAGLVSPLALASGSGASTFTLGSTSIALDATVTTIADLTLSGASVWNGGVVAGQFGGTGVANTGKTITLGASLTTTGAGAPTLAFPASPFTYTFPSAAGTLATLAGTETLSGKTLVAPVIGAATGTSLAVTGLLQAGTTLGISTDVLLNRLAANSLALYNGTSAQGFRTYNTFTDAANGEWSYNGSWNVTANVASYGTNKNGTGSTRNIEWFIGGTRKLDYGITASGASWTALETNAGVESIPIILRNLSSTTSTAVSLGFGPHGSGSVITGKITNTNISGTNDYPMDFYTWGPGASLTSKMRLHGSGGLSIGGTTDPGAGALSTTAAQSAYVATAIPAGGTTGAGMKMSSTANFGVFFGSGAPTLSAAKGSLYLRSDGSGTGDRAYINTNGTTTWTALTTAA